MCSDGVCDIVVECGMRVCVVCGKVVARDLNTSNTSFSQRFSSLGQKRYSRKKRFNNRILGALQRRINHSLDLQLVRYLKQCHRRKKLNSPEELLLRMSEYRSPRKPYLHALLYWTEVTGEKVELMTREDEHFISMWFDEIFFARNRLAFPRPRPPMATLLQLVVQEFDLKNVKYLVRFTRHLRCPARTRKYYDQTQKCFAYIKNGGLKNWDGETEDCEKVSQSDRALECLSNDGRGKSGDCCWDL